MEITIHNLDGALVINAWKTPSIAKIFTKEIAEEEIPIVLIQDFKETDVERIPLKKLELR